MRTIGTRIVSLDHRSRTSHNSHPANLSTVTVLRPFRSRPSVAALDSAVAIRPKRLCWRRLMNYQRLAVMKMSKGATSPSGGAPEAATPETAGDALEQVLPVYYGAVLGGLCPDRLRLMERPGLGARPGSVQLAMCLRAFVLKASTTKNVQSVATGLWKGKSFPGHVLVVLVH